MQIRSADDVVTKLAQDPQFEADVRANPQAAIAKIAVPFPLQNDNWIYRIVVISLGVVALSVIVGQVILALNNTKAVLSEGTVAIASAAIGALAGLLAPSPTKG